MAVSLELDGYRSLIQTRVDIMNEKSNPRRDFIGYADQPPAVVWPDEARIAVNFCINYEEGGELCILNGDDRSESAVCTNFSTTCAGMNGSGYAVVTTSRNTG
ncbi:MAG: hypothetical protein GY875_12515 [Gammaproteobacteria bacterium]|nr:hypothetical protein [Gammaproteobacteria bacterium]